MKKKIDNFVKKNKKTKMTSGGGEDDTRNDDGDLPPSRTCRNTFP